MKVEKITASGWEIPFEALPIEAYSRLINIQLAVGDTGMIWQLRIQYANGTEKVLRSFKNRETALRCVDRIYSYGYPLHIAYVVRSAPAV